MVNPGEIYWADFPEAARRPVIIVSRESLNRGETALVAPLTTAHFARRSQLPNCVPFSAGEFGLPRACVAQGEKMTTLNITSLDLLDGPIGRVDDERLRDLVRAVGHVIDAECEPL